MELVQCIYCSASTNAALTEQSLQEILAKSRQNNAGLDVTGMLLYDSGSFIQVLEGDRPVVEALFEKINRDRRHDRVTKLVLEPIEKRAFAEWSMGYPRVTRKKLAEIPGLNDFFSRGYSLLELGENRARTLLNAFKSGNWRLS